MKVMAIDPGGKTGIAWAEVSLNRGSIIREVQRSFAARTGATRELLGHDTEERTWNIIEAIGEIEPDEIVVEDFVLFVWKRLSMAREMIEPHAINANLRFLWWLAKHNDEPLWTADNFDLPRLSFQMPGERNDVTDAQLRKWGLWRTPKQGGGKDAMSALKHMLVYLKKEARKK